MYFSLMWTLRAAFGMFVSGVAILVLSIFMLLNTPYGDSNAPFVPGVFAFGTLPWLATMVFGFFLIFRAWRHGQQEKLGVSGFECV